MTVDTANPVLTGRIIFGEAQATRAELQKRASGAGWTYQVALVALASTFSIVGWELGPAGAGSVAGAVLGAILADLLYSFVGSRTLLAEARRKFSGQGLPLEFPIRIEITPDALVSEFGDVRRIARWQVVTELFRSHGYWIFMEQGDPVFAPIHHFSNDDEQRAFVAAALARMTEQARMRSSQAVAYAAQAG